MDEFSGAYVYLLTNDKGNVLYTGVTSNLKERLYLHKKRMVAGFTRKYNVTRLVYFESHPNIEAARVESSVSRGKPERRRMLLSNR